MLGPIPVTAPARTLCDLASVVDHDRLEVVLDDALRRELVTIERMQRRIDALACKGRSGIELIRELVAARDPSQPPPHSPLETQVARLLANSDLPEPIRQFEISHGGKRVFVDFAFPWARLAIEADGYKCHSGRQPWENDRARLNFLTSLGWRVIHVTARMLKRPAELMRASQPRSVSPRRRARPSTSTRSRRHTSW